MSEEEKSRHLRLEQEEQWLRSSNHFIITLSDSRYPTLLKQISDPPKRLYVIGNLERLSCPQVAVVGSRLPSASGRELAMEIAGDLAKAGIVVTSGLAIGIDAVAHAAALSACASTVAVLGNGLSSIYPHCHRRLAQEIVTKQGALVSELPLNSPPRAIHFPRRNRIISGLSLGTVVVEATLRSGSLITARFAAEQNREVFAVPGSVRNPLSAGCHHLIRQGALLINSAEDIISELKEALAPFLSDRPGEPSPGNAPTASLLRLDAQEQKLLECIGFERTVIDQLVIRSGYGMAELSSLLLDLELKGYIKVELGGIIRLGCVPKAH